MKKHLIFWIFFLYLAYPAYTQLRIPVFVSDSLDNYVLRAMKAEQLPGLAICIVKNGKVVLMKGYGVCKQGAGEPVDENTLFMIGSNTKAFTATALAKLDFEKKISLDDPVTKWLPDFTLDNKMAGEQAIIRDLLCHRLGFKTFQGDFMYWKSDLSREDVINKMGQLKAVYPFRTTWGYCNAGFLTAGEIIPKVTGIKWEDYIRENFFVPLGMTRTLALNRELPKVTNKASAHDIVNGKVIAVPYCMIDNLASAATISSSVNDMSKWVIMLLNNGMYGETRVVPAEAIAETRFPNSIMGNNGGMFDKTHFRLYGLGFDLKDYAGKLIVSHTGAVTGFLSSVTLVPEDTLGIVILTNSIRNSIFASLREELLDAYLGLPYRSYSHIYESEDRWDGINRMMRVKQLLDSASLNLSTSLPLKMYTGEYSHYVYGRMKIVQEKGELRMIFSHHPNMYAKLESLGNDRFFATFSDPEFEEAVFPFKVEKGKVMSVTVKVADFIDYTSYLFTKTDN
jgi:CubicO group peptidase (beta-lactamase class C family)